MKNETVIKEKLGRFKGKIGKFAKEYFISKNLEWGIQIDGEMLYG